MSDSYRKNKKKFNHKKTFKNKNTHQNTTFKHKEKPRPKKLDYDKNDVAKKDENGNWIFEHIPRDTLFIPEDPQILVSFINMKLRDNYKSLDLLCSDLNISKDRIIKKLKSIEYIYDDKLNKFI